MTRPEWADALRNMLAGLVRQGPKPLLAGLAYFAGDDVPIASFTEYVLDAEENDPALVQLRLTISAWDSLPRLGENHPVTEPRTLQRRLAIYRAMELDDDSSHAVSERVPVSVKPSVVISKKFEPWYANARDSRTSVYWDDYETYLRDVKRWPADAIHALDETSTDVIERLSDPTRESIKQSKGLVVGYVQSGKTANFTGVVAKAIDAGYRLIVVLTGTIEILRAQTQRRMDMELIGIENILSGLDPDNPAVAKELDYQQDADWIAGNFVRHGSKLDQTGVVNVQRVTTHRSDYKRLPAGLTRLKFHKFERTMPLNHPDNLFRLDAYVAVIKKNPASLRKLIADLSPIKGDLSELPVLIIDDESDQASVDTTNPTRWRTSSGGKTPAERRRTTINGLITDFLKLCPRAQYVGYTATPFANVFIDPDDESDLFPADFVLSLDPPPSYMGVRDFHDVDSAEIVDRDLAFSNEAAYVRALKGSPTDDPDRRLRELQEALDSWVLSGAIKKYREELGLGLRFRHHTMLVHESVKQAEHFETAAVVRKLWRTSAFTGSAGLSRLRALYESDFGPVMAVRSDERLIPDSFDALKPYIAKAYSAMTVDADPVLIINSDKTITENQKKLDFESDDVWRILVGGAQLSRGFTVEGLTISYFRRKSTQADTLMQAGRWFGFRPGYRDLVRLYIRRDSDVDLYEAFEALLLDEEDFRSELRQYEGMDENGIPLVEPRQIPPLVSQHLPWLRPTARTKMWNAVIDSKATAHGFQDLFTVPERGDADSLHNVIRVAGPLLSVTGRSVRLPYIASGSEKEMDFLARVGSISGSRFLELLDEMRWHPEDIAYGPLRNFIERQTIAGLITGWTVVWPQLKVPGPEVRITGLGGAELTQRARRGLRFTGSSEHHRQPGLEIVRGGSVEEVGTGVHIPGSGARDQGVVLVYLVDDRSADDWRKGGPPKLENATLLLSVAVPAMSTPRRRDLIRWTVRMPERAGETSVRRSDVAHRSDR